jgi:ATP-binding cassette subfamily C (CFTR/MRP) protein 1
VTQLYRTNRGRLATQVRGGLVGLIHDRSLTLQDGHYDESAAITLMSSDTNNVSYSLDMAWEIPAILVELAVGITLLARQVGWAVVMPFFFVVGKYLL